MDDPTNFVDHFVEKTRRRPGFRDRVLRDPATTVAKYNLPVDEAVRLRHVLEEMKDREYKHGIL